MKFSIKGLLVLLTFVSLCVALVVSQLQLADAKSELETQRAKFHFLNVTDPAKIAAVRMPRFVSEKLWQWRIHLPADRRFHVQAAYNDLKPNRPPRHTKSTLSYELDPGESILSVSLRKVDGTWKVLVAAQSETELPSQNSRVVGCKSTEWLDNNRYGAMAVGDDGTYEADPAKPFVLLHLRDSTPQPNGKQVPWNTPTQGVIVWIEVLPAD